VKRLLGGVTAVAVLAVIAGTVVLTTGDGREQARAPADDPAQPGPDGGSPDEPARPLEDAWYEDPDGDFRPTAIEERLGTDPEANECLKGLDCPLISPETGLPREPPQSNTLRRPVAPTPMPRPAARWRNTSTASERGRASC
jgi:hypothetical protein